MVTLLQKQCSKKAKSHVAKSRVHIANRIPKSLSIDGSNDLSQNHVK